MARPRHWASKANLAGCAEEHYPRCPVCLRQHLGTRYCSPVCARKGWARAHRFKPLSNVVYNALIARPKHQSEETSRPARVAFDGGRKWVQP